MKYLTAMDIAEALKESGRSLRIEPSPVTDGELTPTLVDALNRRIKNTGTLAEQIKVVAGMRHAELQYMIENEGRFLDGGELEELRKLEQLEQIWALRQAPNLVEDEVAVSTSTKRCSWSDYALLVLVILVLLAMAPLVVACFLGWTMMWRDTIGWPLR